MHACSLYSLLPVAVNRMYVCQNMIAIMTSSAWGLSSCIHISIKIAIYELVDSYNRDSLFFDMNVSSISNIN